jgi:dihydroxyacetone kinase-like protein
MNPELQRALIERFAGAVLAHTEELSDLDRAIGDGDHGVNMQRGFGAVLGQIDELAAKTPPEALKAIGTTLMMKVGGASGPLYGTLFRALGTAWPADIDAGSLAQAAASAIAAVQRIGKSEVGQKTMLDVLVPVQQELAESGADAPQRVAERVARRAHAAARATIPLRAIRGRASFLGERSIGHMDPGARSSSLMIIAVCRQLYPELDPDLENRA